MIGIVVVWFVNLTRAVRNGWRKLLRRRVDWVQLELSGGLPEFAAMPRWVQRRFLGMQVAECDVRLAHVGPDDGRDCGILDPAVHQLGGGDDEPLLIEFRRPNRIAAGHRT